MGLAEDLQRLRDEEDARRRGSSGASGGPSVQDSAGAYAQQREGYRPHGVMQEGTVTYQNGVPGVMIKYDTPTGSSTEWTPMPGSDGSSIPMNSIGGGGAGGAGGTTGIPGSALIAQATLEAKKRYQTRVADLGKQRSSIFLQSGFTGDVDSETGLTKNLRTDPFNQYGQFQMLNRAQALRSQQAQGENIGRGLGSGGGLAAQNMGNAQFLSGQEDAAFGQSLNDMLQGLVRNQQDYKYEYDSALYQAQLEGARMAIDQGDYPYYPGGGNDQGDQGDQGDQYDEMFSYKGPSVAWPVPQPRKGAPTVQQAVNRWAGKRPVVRRPSGSGGGPLRVQ